ncbi:MAG: peptidase S41, partial [Alistipes sp.]|nr:peptidase S41 [Alistipes sp.]
PHRAERGVPLDEAALAESASLMRRQLKALVAQRLFGTGAFYRVMNVPGEGAFGRAVELLGEWDRLGAPLLQ